MDNPKDNYQFEFHAKTPENDQKHFWFKVGDILELKESSNILNYASEHGLKGNELTLFRKAKRRFSHPTTHLIF